MNDLYNLYIIHASIGSELIVIKIKIGKGKIGLM